MAEVIIFERKGQRRKRTVLSRRRNTLLQRLNLLEESLRKSDLDIDVEKCLLDNLSWTFWSLLEVERALNGQFNIIVIADG